MLLPRALPVRRVDPQRSRQLIQDSRALITSAKELIRQSRWAIRQQAYLQIVCAWCQQTMRWERIEGIAWGQISHSICYDCFAPVFRELYPGNALPLFPQQVE